MSVDYLRLLLNVLILVAVLGVGYLVLKVVRTRARAARMAAWERDGLIDQDPMASDPDLAPEYRARRLAEREGAVAEEDGPEPSSGATRADPPDAEDGTANLSGADSDEEIRAELEDEQDRPNEIPHA